MRQEKSTKEPLSPRLTIRSREVVAHVGRPFSYELDFERSRVGCHTFYTHNKL